MMGTPEDKELEAVWHGFACPRCHTLFRVPRSGMGKRVECPACGEVSLVPAFGQGGAAPSGRGAEPNRFRMAAEVEGGPERGAGSAPAGRAAQGPSDGRDRNESTGQRRVRRKVKKRKLDGSSQEPDWERRPQAGRGRRHRPVTRLLMWSLVASVGLGFGMVAWRFRGAGSEAAASADGSRPPVPPRPPVAPGGTEADGEGGTSSGPADEEGLEAEAGKVDMGAALSRIEASVALFLGASSLEEMVQVVRGGVRMLPRMTNFYEGTGYAPIAYRQIAPDGRILKSGALWSVDVVLEDFTQRPIAVEETAAGYLVDWESWVGYSELGWEEFMEKRPTEGKLFRVYCAPIDYYNFDFQDDRKWRSYRLESPDGEHTLFGYVLRFSTMGATLGLGDENPEVQPQPFLVKLRYPIRGTNAKQVLIEEVISSGWVAEP